MSEENRKLILRDSYEVDSYSVFAGTCVEEAIKKIQAICDKLKERSEHEITELKFKYKEHTAPMYEDCFDPPSLFINAYGPETDEEIRARVEKEEYEAALKIKIAEAKEQKERQEYERLKAKYESK